MSGYTVVDVQTTGLEPTRQHRVVEIAMVMLSDSGEPQDFWCTLVNPQRDVGESSLHGITARDVLDAPIFDDVVPRILRSVRGRTLVAHNLTFELGFLESELRRSGVPLAMPLQVGVPTMEWFGILSSRRRRRLIDCCDAVGIPLTQRYSSAHQVAAVAELMRRYVEATKGSPPWADALDWSSSYPWPELSSEESETPLLVRESRDALIASSWLDRIIAKMPSGGDPRVDEYLDVLEMALLDRYLSAHEIESLVIVAQQSGLDRASVEELHRDYLEAMARVAWEDGVVTQDERDDLASVASLLEFEADAVDAALRTAKVGASRRKDWLGFVLRAGDSICFTGSMESSREILEQEAASKGLVVGGLTKKTRLLVAADPDSLSGKAKKAREYGTTIVNERGFRSLAQQMELR